MVALRGHYDGKVIVPDGPVDLPHGQVLVLHVEVETPEPPIGNASALNWIAENAVDDPSLPIDGALQHDHYLYGTPKI